MLFQIVGFQRRVVRCKQKNDFLNYPALTNEAQKEALDTIRKLMGRFVGANLGSPYE